MVFSFVTALCLGVEKIASSLHDIESMTTAKTVFLSSVRRGLEDERDALPALIKAIGHVATRFEDFTAQPVPSRDACLAGVEDADIYLLLLGPHYGDPIFDSGLSPTEEEWTVAKRRGIPIVVFRKLGVTFDPEQQIFVRRVEDYVTGRFRDTFSGAIDLLPAVVEKIRQLAEPDQPLVWQPLDSPIVPAWVLSADSVRSVGISAILELHILPIDVAARLPASSMERLPERLAQLGREHGLFGPGDALNLESGEARATASRAQSRTHPAIGITVARSLEVGLWEELPRDTMGTILDRADVTSRVARLLRAGAEALPGGGANRVGLAVGLGPTQMVSEGDIRDLGRRTKATMDMRDRVIRIDAEDAVPRETLARAADEIATELATRLILRFQQR